MSLKKAHAKSSRIYYRSKFAINTALFNVEFLQEKKLVS